MPNKWKITQKSKNEGENSQNIVITSKYVIKNNFQLKVINKKYNNGNEHLLPKTCYPELSELFA